ncbi:MAG: Uma2 family endonuclease [Nitrospinae bacterium]|nr:Uma2 family endonuclease [Nitrospinota bacterium]
MGYPLKKEKNKRYTWQDYLTWSDEERWEVIDGKAYDMSPSPTFRHQNIVVNFGGLLRTKLISGFCRVCVAPLDVYFDDYNFVQPDVFVVCDKNKIKDRIYGAPDLIVEVLSPATSLKDKREKKSLYERFGVREYIIVYPEDIFVERYCLKDGRYSEAEVFGPQEAITLCLVDNIEIPLWEIFEVEPPEK